MDKGENVILTKTFDFACEVLDLYVQLNEKRYYVLAKQVCRSGTSIGANVKEAQRAVSKPDFINKLGIALKEADETDYWFKLIDKKVLSVSQKLKSDLDEIIRLLVAIINSSKGNK